jgi:hypothetical protein
VTSQSESALCDLSVRILLVGESDLEEGVIESGVRFGGGGDRVGVV